MAKAVCALSKRKFALLLSVIVLTVICVGLPSLRITEQKSEIITVRKLDLVSVYSADAPLSKKCAVDYRARKGNHTSISTNAKSLRTGYVLCLAFREQQTKAAANLYSLQCWA